MANLNKIKVKYNNKDSEIEVDDNNFALILAIRDLVNVIERKL